MLSLTLQALEGKQLAFYISHSIRTIIAVVTTIPHSVQKSLLLQQQQQPGITPTQVPSLPDGIPPGFTDDELRVLSRCGIRCGTMQPRCCASKGRMCG